MTRSAHRLLVLATLTALVLAPASATWGDCRCAGKTAQAEATAEVAAKFTAEPRSCCAKVADERPDEAAAKMKVQCSRGAAGHWRATCCCAAPQPEPAPTKLVVDRPLKPELNLFAAYDYVAMSTPDQAAAWVGPVPPGERVPRPSFSILYCVWRN